MPRAQRVEKRRLQANAANLTFVRCYDPLALVLRPLKYPSLLKPPESGTSDKRGHLLKTPSPPVVISKSGRAAASTPPPPPSLGGVKKVRQDSTRGNAFPTLCSSSSSSSVICKTGASARFPFKRRGFTCHGLSRSPIRESRPSEV